MAFNMASDKIERPAWINVGDSLALRKCTLIDISDSGAKLTLDDIDELPERFSYGSPVMVIHAIRAGLFGATTIQSGLNFLRATSNPLWRAKQ